MLVEDDFEPWRRFSRLTLQANSRWQVIGEAADGWAAVQQAQALQPDLIVLDIGLPTLNGIEVARQIRNLCPNCRILFLTENYSWEIADAAFEAGASGYVVKSDAAKDLLPGIMAVLEGARFVSSRMAGHSLLGTAHRHKAGFYSDDRAFLDEI